MATREDALLRLRDENMELKRKTHEQEVALKRLQTHKLVLEESVRKTGTAAKDIATEVDVRHLTEELEAMKRKNRTLQDRLRLVEGNVVHKAASQGRVVDYGRLPRPAAGKIAVGINNSLDRSRSNSRERVRPATASGGPSASSAASAASADVTAASLRSAAVPARPATAAALLNESVYSTRSVPAHATGHGHGHAEGALVDSLRSELATVREQLAAAQAAAAAATSPRGVLELERQVKDKSAQVLLLRSRYEHLEARSAAERELYDRAIAALEAQNGQIREGRAALQAAQAEVDMLRAQLRSCGDAEAELRVAREEMRRLERSLTDLCESPFLHEGREGLNRKERLDALEKETAAQKEQIAHLQHTVRAQHLELASVRKERKEASAAAERHKEEADKARASADSAQRAVAALRERLALYSGVLGAEAAPGAGGVSAELSSPVPPVELERALTLVRRRMDSPQAIEQQQQQAARGASDEDSLPGLRRKVQQLQLALLTSQRELERSESLLKAQSSIAGDLAAEVADAHQRLATEGTGMKRKLGDTEALAEKRLQRIHMLEAQVKQLLQKVREVSAARRTHGGSGSAPAAAAATGSRSAAASKRGAAAAHDDDDASTVISALSGEGEDRDGIAGGGADRDGALDGSVDTTSASLLDFGPGENVIEVYLVDATLDPAALTGGYDTTFALLDFYTFASQASPLAAGAAPGYHFSASYRITTDNHMLRHLATQGVSIDINQAKGGDFVMLGRAVVPLHRLLMATSENASAAAAAAASTGSPKLKFAAIPLTARNGRVIGSVRVEVRAGTSLAEHWRSFLEDRPGEGAQLAAVMRERMRQEDAAGGMVTVSSLNTSKLGGATAAAAASANGGASPNELVVTVVSAADLRPRSSAGAARSANPAVYVQYALPGFPACYTPVADASTAPVFADSRALPVVPTSHLLTSLAATPARFLLFDDALAPAARAAATSTSASTANSANTAGLLGTAVVSLAGVAQGGSLDSSFDITDSRGQYAGKLTLRIGWARPLAAADGAPADALTRSQLHALAGVFDRDGHGVKASLLAAVVGMTDDDTRALQRLQDAVVAADAALAALPAATRRKMSSWTDALLDAAEESGRNGGRLTPKEVHAALTAAAVGVRVDQDTVEDVAMALLVENYVRAGDVIDVLSPLSPAAAAALSKVRRYAAATKARGTSGSSDLGACLTAQAAAAAKAGSGGSGEGAGRLPRSALIAALKAWGMMVVEDAGSRVARDPREAPDFTADPHRPIDGVDAAELEDARRLPASSSAAAFAAAASSSSAGAAAAALGSSLGAPVAEEQLRPTLISSAVLPSAASASILNESILSAGRESAADVFAARTAGRRVSGVSTGAAAASSSSSSAETQPVPVTTAVVASTPVAAEGSTGSSRRTSGSGSLHLHELATDPAPVTTTAVPTTTAAAAATATATATAAVAVVDAAPVAYHSGAITPADGAALSIEVAAVTKLHSRLVAAARAGGTDSKVYLSFSFPSRRVVDSTGALTALPAFVCLPAALPESGAVSGSGSGALTFSSGAGNSTITTFPLPAGSPLVRFLAAALAPGATPEDGDVNITLSTAPPTADALLSSPTAVLATAVCSLQDVIDACTTGSGTGSGSSEDACEQVVPLGASAHLAAFQPATAAAAAEEAVVEVGSTVGDLTLKFVGVKALQAVRTA